MTQNTGFTKQDSLAIKGIAIFFMAYHHLFCSSDRFSDYVISFTPFSSAGAVRLSLMLKICVSLFAFISGYGLFRSYSKIENTAKNISNWIFQHIFHLFINFFFVYSLSILITSILNGLPHQKFFMDFSLSTGFIYLLLDASGLSYFFHTPMMLATYWYITAAYMFIILTPLLVELSEKISYSIIFMLICLLPFLLRIDYPGGENPYTFLPIVMMGIIFSKYQTFEKIEEKLSLEKHSFLKYGLPAWCILLIYIVIRYRGIPNQDQLWIINYCLFPTYLKIVLRYFFIRIPIINPLLNFIGLHSMTFFLTHNYLRIYYCNDFIYGFENHILVTLVLLILGIILAVIIDYLKKWIHYERFESKLKKYLFHSSRL